MATQEQDFNKETNRQCTRLFIKDSQGITIDLTEIQCAQVLQSLLTLSELQGRLTSSARGGGPGLSLLSRLLRPTAGEMQDIEVNSLLQGQSIHIQNCADVSGLEGGGSGAYHAYAPRGRVWSSSSSGLMLSMSDMWCSPTASKASSRASPPG
jgi:hypothetical protein